MHATATSAVEARDECIRRLERELAAAARAAEWRQEQLLAACGAKLEQARAAHERAAEAARREAGEQAARADRLEAAVAALRRQVGAAAASEAPAARAGSSSGGGYEGSRAAAQALAAMEGRLASLSAALRERDAEIARLRSAAAAGTGGCASPSC